MDTELARTFLEIVSTGSFVRAAERLNVAQTTVSARIRSLEDQLGRQLFIRNKSGATLTAAGEHVLRYAPTFVQLWQRVRHQVGVPAGHSAVLAIGAEVSLWHPLLLDWAVWMRAERPDLAIRVQVDVPQDLLTQVAEGLVDVAVLHAPPPRPGLKIDLLVEDKLVMVAAGAVPADPLGPGYVAIDWGPSFARDFAASFPDAATPALSISLGPLAVNYLLSAGGTGYVRWRAAGPHLESGRLQLVRGFPQFSFPVYAVYPANLADDLIAPALAGLKALSTGSGPQRPGSTTG